MNNELKIRIRKDLSPLSKPELVETILFLMDATTIASRYTLETGYDVPELVRSIRRETIENAIDDIIKENGRLLEELSELRRSLPGTSTTTMSVLNRLERNTKRYNKLSNKLDQLEYQTSGGFAHV